MAAGRTCAWWTGWTRAGLSPRHHQIHHRRHRPRPCKRRAFPPESRCSGSRLNWRPLWHLPQRHCQRNRGKVKHTQTQDTDCSVLFTCCSKRKYEKYSKNETTQNQSIQHACFISSLLIVLWPKFKTLFTEILSRHLKQSNQVASYDYFYGTITITFSSLNSLVLYEKRKFCIISFGEQNHSSFEKLQNL